MNWHRLGVSVQLVPGSKPEPHLGAPKPLGTGDCQGDRDLPHRLPACLPVCLSASLTPVTHAPLLASQLRVASEAGSVTGVSMTLACTVPGSQGPAVLITRSQLYNTLTFSPI